MSGATASRPGSSSSCERSRSGSYIGCGNVGAAITVSMPTVGAAPGVRPLAPRCAPGSGDTTRLRQRRTASGAAASAATAPSASVVHRHHREWRRDDGAAAPGIDARQMLDRRASGSRAPTVSSAGAGRSNENHRHAAALPPRSRTMDSAPQPRSTRRHAAQSGADVPGGAGVRTPRSWWRDRAQPAPAGSRVPSSSVATQRDGGRARRAAAPRRAGSAVRAARPMRRIAGRERRQRDARCVLTCAPACDCGLAGGDEADAAEHRGAHAQHRFVARAWRSGARAGSSPTAMLICSWRIRWLARCRSRPPAPRRRPSAPPDAAGPRACRRPRRCASADRGSAGRTKWRRPRVTRRARRMPAAI